MLSKWNENFLSQDMSSYHAKYEEANKQVFFLKGKAQATLVAEMQLFAVFPVEVEQIPLYLTEITAYQQEEQKMEAAEAELSYDWKQILKEHLTNEELQSYKVQIQNQRKNIVRFAGLLQQMSLIHISEPTRQAEISHPVFCLAQKNSKTLNS